MADNTSTDDCQMSTPVRRGVAPFFELQTLFYFATGKKADLHISL
jgi:hypothetical protein